MNTGPYACHINELPFFNSAFSKTHDGKYLAERTLNQILEQHAMLVLEGGQD
jgi:hypothetical protein